MPAILAAQQPLLTTNMKIRTYKKSDFDIVSEIYSSSKLDELIYEKCDFKLIPLSNDKKRYGDFLSSNIYVVELNSQVVGFLGYRDNHISWLFVHPDYRGKGLGAAMIVFIKSKLKKYITLNVAASNYLVIDLYKKQGFVISDKLTSEYNGIPVNVIEMKFEVCG